jgi:hypothetical protein
MRNILCSEILQQIETLEVSKSITSQEAFIADIDVVLLSTGEDSVQVDGEEFGVVISNFPLDHSEGLCSRNL